MDGLLLRPGDLLPFLLDLLQLGAECPPPPLSFLEAHDLGLIRVESALTLPFQPLLPLAELVLLRGQRGEIVLFGLGPGLMQARDHLWVL